MNYIEAIDYVHAIPKFVRPLGNEKLGGLLDLLGLPQDKLKFIHVAGTNGKGSVCRMTAEILKSAGYKTGLFTSPFIEVFNERIQINNVNISDDDLARYITDMADIMKTNNISVSEFAFITAVALKYFADLECDIVVLETGMGGRLDATNIIPTPVCTALTSISLDHTQYLGDTIEEIALEKCGIIKSGAKVVTAQNRLVQSVIAEQAEKADAELIVCGNSLKTKSGFIYKGEEYRLGLKGEYQAENAAIVCEMVDVLRSGGYKISDDALRDGFKNAHWMARYEFITPDIVIDGGHNIDGIRALKKSLMAEKRDVILVLTMMQDKDYKECIKELCTIARKVIATELDMPRGLKCSEIQSICEGNKTECIAEPDILKAVKMACDMADGGLVCVCGSLYLAGDVRKIINNGGLING